MIYYVSIFVSFFAKEMFVWQQMPYTMQEM